MTTIGRPTLYSADLANEICDAIATSSKGLEKLCGENPHWPEARTIYRWLKSHPEFSQSYPRAKQLQIEALVDEILAIADDSSSDYMVNEEGRLVVNHEHIQRAKLRIDTRKWLASKLVPKVYGDRVQTDVTVDSREELQNVRDIIHKYRQEQANTKTTAI